MATWKVTMALALASVMLAGLAFAQATTGSPATAGETTKSDTGMKSDSGMKASASRSRKGAMSTAGDERVKAAQQALREKGHDPGSVDGRMGPKTQQALRDFQNAQGMQATGHLDAKTMHSLGVEGGTTSSAGESTTSGSASPVTGSSASGSTTDAPKSDAGKPKSAKGASDDAKK